MKALKARQRKGILNKDRTDGTKKGSKCRKNCDYQKTSFGREHQDAVQTKLEKPLHKVLGRAKRISVNRGSVIFQRGIKLAIY